MSEYSWLHIFTIWYGRDFIALSLIFYILLICAADLKYSLSDRLKSKYNIRQKSEDIVFIHLFIIIMVLIILDISFGVVSLPVLVHYLDVRSSFLRVKLMFGFIQIYFVLGLSFSVFLVFKAKEQRLKWFLYGLFFNILAFLYLIKSERTGKSLPERDKIT